MPRHHCLDACSTRAGWLRLGLWALGLAALACRPPTDGGASPEASRPAANAIVRVGTSGDYEPFSRRRAGRVEGFDAEVAEAIARDLGWQIEWVAFRWPDLQTQVERGDFDVAMSGVTWRPSRAVVGYMTRAVASGGPCLLGDPDAELVAVNRGGMLEAWARRHLSDRRLRTVDDNLRLPDLLVQGEVGAIVTDSFELPSFRRPGLAERCEPPLSRKVYWVAPGRERLAANLDDWLQRRTAVVEELQLRFLGQRQALDELTHLGDLLGRRMAFMPAVAAYKNERGLPIEDRDRERRVVAAAVAAASAAGLPEPAVRRLFSLQIELSKAVQRRAPDGASSLDLVAQIRPALTGLGDRIVTALARAREARRLASISETDLLTLSPWLEPTERRRLASALREVQGDATTH